MSEKLSRSFILLFFLVFYQLDYRERVTGSISIPGLKEISVTKSFETRYRPIKKLNKSNEQMRKTDGPSEDFNDSF